MRTFPSYSVRAVFFYDQFCRYSCPPFYKLPESAMPERYQMQQIGVPQQLPQIRHIHNLEQQFSMSEPFPQPKLSLLC